MNPRRVLFIASAFVSLSVLQLGLIACGGGGSSGAPGYTLTAAALNPSSVTAGNTSASVIKVTSLNGYTGSVSLSCSITTLWHAGSAVFPQHDCRDDRQRQFGHCHTDGIHFEQHTRRQLHNLRYRKRRQ